MTTANRAALSPVERELARILARVLVKEIRGEDQDEAQSTPLKLRREVPAR